MVTRIKDMPVYATRDAKIAAPLYNLWRRAHLHYQFPLRIEMPELKQMALILEEDCWVLVDQTQYDLPILAWLEFEDKGRSSLHTPVDCKLNFYHHMASQVREKALTCLAQALEVRLKNY